jgi:hypothetical protein
VKILLTAVLDKTVAGFYYIALYNNDTITTTTYRITVYLPVLGSIAIGQTQQQQLVQNELSVFYVDTSNYQQNGYLFVSVTGIETEDTVALYLRQSTYASPEVYDASVVENLDTGSAHLFFPNFINGDLYYLTITHHNAFTTPFQIYVDELLPQSAVNNNGNNDGTSTGVIVGIVIGVAAGTIALVLVLVVIAQLTKKYWLSRSTQVIGSPSQGLDHKLLSGDTNEL